LIPKSRRNSVPHWISETVWTIVTFVPALFVAEDSPNFALIRAMFALMLVVLIVYLMAMRPFRSAIAHCWSKAAAVFARRP
jgi:hypothetical protein